MQGGFGANPGSAGAVFIMQDGQLRYVANTHQILSAQSHHIMPNVCDSRGLDKNLNATGMPKYMLNSALAGPEGYDAMTVDRSYYERQMQAADGKNQITKKRRRRRDNSGNHHQQYQQKSRRHASPEQSVSLPTKRPRPIRPKPQMQSALALKPILPKQTHGDPTFAYQGGACAQSSRARPPTTATKARHKGGARKPSDRQRRPKKEGQSSNKRGSLYKESTVNMQRPPSGMYEHDEMTLDQFGHLLIPSAEMYLRDCNNALAFSRTPVVLDNSHHGMHAQSYCHQLPPEFCCDDLPLISPHVIQDETNLMNSAQTECIRPQSLVSSSTMMQSIRPPSSTYSKSLLASEFYDPREHNFTETPAEQVQFAEDPVEAMSPPRNTRSPRAMENPLFTFEVYTVKPPVKMEFPDDLATIYVYDSVNCWDAIPSWDVIGEAWDLFSRAARSLKGALPELTDNEACDSVPSTRYDDGKCESLPHGLFMDMPDFTIPE